jgi:hypothetical protein
VLYAVAMAGVSFVAHQIVAYFGAWAGFAVVGAMIATARWYDKRERR